VLKFRFQISDTYKYISIKTQETPEKFTVFKFNREQGVEKISSIER